MVGSHHIIALLNQRAVNGHLNQLRPGLSGWDNTPRLLRDLHRVPSNEPEEIALEYEGRAHQLGRAWASPITQTSQKGGVRRGR